MKNWILVVGYSHLHFEAAQKEWLKFNVLLQSAATVTEAIHMFSTRPYIAVIASFELPDMMLLIRAMREPRKVPLLVLPQEDSGAETAESIIKGADTFIIDTENLIDSIKNSKDIIDHISELSPHNKQLLGVLTFRELFMMVEYHKLFVGAIEVILAKSDFAILQLLLSQAGRVFTYDQLYLSAYEDEAPKTSPQNAVRCHIFRLRRSLRIEDQTEEYIESVRSIGYRIAI